MSQLHAAQQSAVIMLTAASADDDTCATEATAVAVSDANTRVLVGFCLLESAHAWTPAGTPLPMGHPIFGPALMALRAGEDDLVRELLVDAFTGRDAGAYATLLVQFAYGTRDLVPQLKARLRERGLELATDPDASADRDAGT